MHSPLKLSIVIPVHLLDSNFRICLNALEKSIDIDSTELVIVLDGVDNDHDFFNSFTFSHIKVITLQKNHGPAFARNEGAKEASSDLLLFLDSDVAVNTDLIYRVNHYFEDNPKIDAAIGSYDDQPEVETLVSLFRNLLHHYVHQQASERVITFWGACGAIRKEVFFDVGGFDKFYKKPSVEDIELGYRLCQKGYHITLKKDLQVKHLKHWSFTNMVYTDIFRRAKPWTLLLFLNPEIKQRDLNIKISQRWASIFIILFFGGLAVSLFIPQLLLVSMISLVFIYMINYKFYNFLSNRFRYFELPLVIALHWIYYMSAMIGLFLGFFDFFLSDKSNFQSSKHK